MDGVKARLKSLGKMCCTWWSLCWKL